jgi:hypothetical protein
MSIDPGTEKQRQTDMEGHCGVTADVIEGELADPMRERGN